jgi:hypothetical protein
VFFRGQGGRGGAAGAAAVNQLVNIVLNRRRDEAADSSLSSDDTIELHLSGNRRVGLKFINFPPQNAFENETPMCVFLPICLFWGSWSCH